MALSNYRVVGCGLWVVDLNYGKYCEFESKFEVGWLFIFKVVTTAPEVISREIE